MARFRNARSRGQHQRAARRAQQASQAQNPENVAAARREEVRQQNNQFRR